MSISHLWALTESPAQPGSRHFPAFFHSPASLRPAAGGRRLFGQQSGLAELMLVNRLRARTRRDLAPDTLERAADVIALTARHWFGEAVAGAQAAS